MKKKNCLPLHLRAISAILAVAQSSIVAPVQVRAEILVDASTVLGTPQLINANAANGIPVNRTIPKKTAPSIFPQFCSEPTDAEISRATIAGQNLLPSGRSVSREENRALGRALIAFSRRANEDDTSSLESFLKAYPESRWRISLLAGLATHSLKTGYFSKALGFLETAWTLGRDETDAKLQALANWTRARLANLNTQLGRADEAELLLHELRGREISGPATELITSAAEGVWSIKNRPEQTRRCGLTAAAILYSATNPKGAPPDKLRSATTTSRGTSLTQLANLMNSVGLKYQMAKRTPGSTVMSPSIVNWKLGHFATVLRREGDRYLVADPTLGESLWIGAKALDAEASGYFLVPSGDLPSGWEPVTRSEGQRVWGAGTTSDTDPDNTKPDDKKVGDRCPGSSAGTSSPPMAQYSFHAATVSLNMVDTPLFYNPARGQNVALTVTYNQRDANQPIGTFPFSNFGPKWTFNWLSFIIDNSGNPYVYPKLYVQGGGAETYKNYNSQTGTYDPGIYSQAVLVRVSGTKYERNLPDGSKETFDYPDSTVGDGRRVFLTKITDPAGNSITLTYDANFRLTQLTDAVGQQTTFYYDPTDVKRITSVEDPFHRVATFEYYSDGHLKKITDMGGLTSEFTYGTGLKADFITSLTTPYGTTTFRYDDHSTDPDHLCDRTRWLEATDPLGGTERVDFNERTDIGIPLFVTEPIPCGLYNRNYVMYARNTFFWSKRAITEVSQSCRDVPYSCGAADYSKAHLFHWLHSNGFSWSGGIIESEKKPLETRIWYNYPGQPQCADQECCPSPYTEGATLTGTSNLPTKVARVLADGTTTQLRQYEYNAAGKITKAIDSRSGVTGRVTSYVYDTNNIDLLSVYQRNPDGHQVDPDGQPADLIEQHTYNSQHEPLTSCDWAICTTFTYNSYGQILTRQNGDGETTFGYGDGSPGHPIGYLTSITSPPVNNASAVLSFTYDSANRVRTVTDSDNYTITTDYDNLDRPTQLTYPDTTTKQFQYTQDFGQGLVPILDLTTSIDRRGLVTTRHYDSNRHMDWIADPRNKKTRFGWCGCGQLESIKDPKGQITTFYRDIQGRVYQKLFADGTAINYLYDGQTAAQGVGATSRLQSSTDAKSQRTNYTYFLDDNVQQITYTGTNGQPLVPPTPSVNFTYDTNYNRVLTMTDGSGPTVYGYYPITDPVSVNSGRLASIDGPLSHDTITFGYDPVGRINTRSINGSSNSEVWEFDSLGRVSTDANKLGTFNYAYFGVTNRLDTLTYPNGQTANYTYFDNLQDKHLQQIKNLTSASALISQFDYTYDDEGQVLTWKKNYPGLLPAPQRYDLTYDNADRLKRAPLKNATTNTVITNYLYDYDDAANRTLETVGTVTTNSTPNSVNEIISQSGGTNRNLTYDFNGSLVDDGLTRTFEWDGANRLVAINTGTTNRSEFTYDGLSRCVKVVEKTNGSVTSTRKFVWCGNDMCEFRDANDAVTLFVYPQGQSSGTKYFYTRDHLGSIREMFKTNDAVVARYDYDPWGRSTTKVNTTLPDFNFTGLYRHGPSNLDMAVRRFYDPDLGRWISRDPIGELGGVNLYRYVFNDPENHIDPFGLDPPFTNLPLTLFHFGDQFFKMMDPSQPPPRKDPSGYPLNRDKYFHCMANCQSAKDGGILDSLALDVAREMRDMLKKACQKRDPEIGDSLEDMKANVEGLKHGINPFSDCAEQCSGLL